MPLLGACTSFLPHIKEKCALPGLHVSFAKSQKAVQPNCLFTEKELRGGWRGKKCAADMFFLFTALFLDRNLSFEGRSELTGLRVQYTEIASRVLADLRDQICMEEKWVTVRSETE